MPFSFAFDDFLISFPQTAPIVDGIKMAITLSLNSSVKMDFFLGLSGFLLDRISFLQNRSRLRDPLSFGSKGLRRVNKYTGEDETEWTRERVRAYLRVQAF